MCTNTKYSSCSEPLPADAGLLCSAFSGYRALQVILRSRQCLPRYTTAFKKLPALRHKLKDCRHRLRRKLMGVFFYAIHSQGSRSLPAILANLGAVQFSHQQRTTGQACTRAIKVGAETPVCVTMARRFWFLSTYNGC